MSQYCAKVPKTKPFVRTFGLVAVAAGCFLHSGCSRAFWREQADRDTCEILTQKTSDPRWSLPRLDVTPDPRSRFYDPYDPDASPLPPDDPSAHEYMHWVAGKRGYKSWHKLGTAFSIENPHWLEPFGMTPEMTTNYEQGGSVPLPRVDKLTLERAIELASIHNRDYQTEIERLYLTALDLTFDRFQFNVRYLGDPSVSLTHKSVPDGENSLTLGGGAGLSQLLPTGAQLAVDLANTTVWIFSGANQTNAATTLSYSLVQPLLRSAGRKIVLEGLTQAERDVLYQTRLLARFRKEFFTDTVTGGGQSGGFLGLLLQRQNVVNQEGNLNRLIEQTDIQRVLASQKPDEIAEELEALPAGLAFPPELAGKVRYDEAQHVLFWRGAMSEEQQSQLLQLSNDDAFQKAAKELIQRLRSETTTLTVLQLESELAAARNRLRTSERQFRDGLDRFKLDLGLPTDMPVTLDLAMLKPFELIDPALPKIEQSIKDYALQWAESGDVEPDLAQLRRLMTALIQLKENVRDEGLRLIDTDIGRVQQLLTRDADSTQAESLVRQRAFESEEEQQRVLKDFQNDQRLYAGLKNDFTLVEGQLETLSTELQQGALTQERQGEIASLIADLREQLLKISQSLQVIQIGLRVELIAVEPFELSDDDAVRLGLDNRLDLMNMRASVTDARRAVEIAADQLEAVLDIRFEGDLKTPTGNRPFDFRGSQSSFRAGIDLDAPLDLVAERNAYREALINYQRSRRDYMAFEDNVKLSIRERWRQLDVTRQNFEISRQRVRIAALQYDSAVEDATAPLQQRSGRGGALDLLNALDSVLSAQNNLIADWINYERSRIQIYRDMGIMEIDANGIWQDEYYQKRAYGHESDTGETENRPDAATRRTMGEASTVVVASHAEAVDVDERRRRGDGWHPRSTAGPSKPTGQQHAIGFDAIRDGGRVDGAHAHHGDGARAGRESE